MHLPIHQAVVGLEILVDGARVEAPAGQALQDGARVVLERDGARVADMAAERAGHLEVMAVEADIQLVEALEVILEDGAMVGPVVGKAGN